MEQYFGHMRFVRLLFQRSLGCIYLIAFIVVLNQFPALLGEKGLLPVSEFIKNVPFQRAPSIFYLGYSDHLLVIVAWIGIILSACAILGITEKGPWWVSMALWLVMWVLYLSIVNVGQVFYSFGWESMLCEAGFFCAFLGSSRVMPSMVPILILRWMLFRLELGSGLIKLRGDECWRNCTCLFYHFETQPLPNPLSWYFHHLPKIFLVMGVAFNHFVEIVVPFGLFAWQGIAALCGGLIIFHQLLLIAGGNYAFLNWLTVVLGITALNDNILSKIIPLKSIAMVLRSRIQNGILYALAIVTFCLSIQPALNLFSKRQYMNYSYNPLQLVNSYGAFGSVTRVRYELIIEGTRDAFISAHTRWKEYEFKGKPGDVRRMPPQIAPYQLHLDWQMWFIPFTVTVTDHGLAIDGYDLWFLRFIEKLLEGDRPTLKLLAGNPFPGSRPYFIRVMYYRYRFTDWQERQKTGAWWKRTLVGQYLPPVDLSVLKDYVH
ncbi:MAG: lipase maturation factor family protein [Candidatus Omnitrophica bacterium]|nr:lipase maturation factor family protein [Candidatus Omnitrophota bacterium]